MLFSEVVLPQLAVTRGTNDFLDSVKRFLKFSFILCYGVGSTNLTLSKHGELLYTTIIGRG